MQPSLRKPQFVPARHLFYARAGVCCGGGESRATCTDRGAPPPAQAVMDELQARGVAYDVLSPEDALRQQLQQA